MRFPYKAYADMVAHEKESDSSQRVAKKSAAEDKISESAIENDEELPADGADDVDESDENLVD